MHFDLITVNTVYFGLSATLAPFMVGKSSRIGPAAVLSAATMLILNLLALVGVLPR